MAEALLSLYLQQQDACLRPLVKALSCSRVLSPVSLSRDILPLVRAAATTSYYRPASRAMRLADLDVASNNNEYQKIAKSLAELKEIYQTYQRSKECEAQLEDAGAMKCAVRDMGI